MDKVYQNYFYRESLQKWFKFISLFISTFSPLINQLYTICILSVNTSIFNNKIPVEILLQQPNDTHKHIMDRLFGKELSNLLDSNLYNNNKAKQPGRIHSQSGRFLNQDHPKQLTKRFNRSSFGHNQNQNQNQNKKQEKDKLEKIVKVVEKVERIEKVEKVQVLVQKIEKQYLCQQTLREQKHQVLLTLAEDAKSQIHDPQLVPEYFDDCFKFMMKQESKNYKLKNYMGDQTEINEKMRGILLDWIVDLHQKFKMFPSTLYATIMIIDIYLSKCVATKQNLQLIGTSAMYIAAKYEETYRVPDLEDLVHFSARAFTKEQIIKMQAEIIDVLEFNLIMETSFRFFEPLAKICDMEPKNFCLAQYTLELSLFDVNFLNYKPSLVASSAIYLINKIRKRSESWPVDLEAVTGYAESDIKGCAKQLCHLLERADQLPNTKSLRKKFSQPQYHQVTRIKLQRKKQ